MAVAFPYGYGSTTMTWDQLMTRTTVNRLHPEFLRRIRAMCEAAAAEHVPLGIGTGFRFEQPLKAGFASNGNSNHQGFEPDGADAVAADMVPNTSWDWMEKNCARFGLRTFRNVNREPWHIQPVEIPASRNYRRHRWDLDRFTLPEVAPEPPNPEPPPPPPGRPITVEFTSRTLRVGDKGNDVKFLQKRLNQLAGQDLTEDGDFGGKTEQAVKNLQAFFGIAGGADGVAGANTQRSLIELGFITGN